MLDAGLNLSGKTAYVLEQLSLLEQERLVERVFHNQSEDDYDSVEIIFDEAAQAEDVVVSTDPVQPTSDDTATFSSHEKSPSFVPNSVSNRAESGDHGSNQASFSKSLSRSTQMDTVVLNSILQTPSSNEQLVVGKNFVPNSVSSKKCQQLAVVNESVARDLQIVGRLWSVIVDDQEVSSSQMQTENLRRKSKEDPEGKLKGCLSINPNM